jgi:hypothetical protein
LKILFLEGLNWCPVFCGIYIRPKNFTIGVQARLVGVDSFPAFFLPVSLLPAEDAGHLVAIGIVARIGSPLLLIVVPKITLRTKALFWLLMICLLLASILIGAETPLPIVRDGFNRFFLVLLLNGLNLRGSLSLVLRAELNGS